MNIADVPAQVLVTSFLKAAKKGGVEAVVFYTERDGVRSVSRATSNTGPGGIAKAVANLKFQGDAVVQAAMMLHKLSPLIKPVPWWKRMFGGGKVAPDPENMPSVCDFKSLDEATQDNYKKIIAAVLGAASSQAVYSPIVS